MNQTDLLELALDDLYGDPDGSIRVTLLAIMAKLDDAGLGDTKRHILVEYINDGAECGAYSGQSGFGYPWPNDLFLPQVEENDLIAARLIAEHVFGESEPD